MAAASDAYPPELLELRHLRPGDLDDVLQEEVLTWRSTLSWDYTPSTELVRRFVRIQALSGFALVIHGSVVGYCYYVCEERKGLIGDLYVMRDFATAHNEDLLLSAVLNVLKQTPHVQRIEAQLMMSRGPFERALPMSRFVQIYSRNFMVADLDGVQKLPPGRADVHVDLWDERRQDEAAQVIAAAYQGHIDSSINDQYRSVSGARRFLLNIVQYPGCGSFFGPASYLAQVGSRVGGLCLSSMVASDAGHITQICVAPEVKGRGVGYELLRRSLVSLADQGCAKTSLTVTASNEEAIALYQRVGFRAVRRFAAYVWEGF